MRLSRSGGIDPKIFHPPLGHTRSIKEEPTLSSSDCSEEASLQTAVGTTSSSSFNREAPFIQAGLPTSVWAAVFTTTCYFTSRSRTKHFVHWYSECNCHICFWSAITKAPPVWIGTVEAQIRGSATREKVIITSNSNQRLWTWLHVYVFCRLPALFHYITSCKCERSASALRRLNNYMQSSMGHDPAPFL